MKWLRRGAAAVGIVLAIPLVLVALLLVAVQIPFVQSWLATTVAELTADTDMQVRIDDLGGSIPFAPTIGRLTLADRQGVWLEANDARLDVAWTALFGGRIHVRELAAARIAVLRTPVSTAPEPPPEPFSLPDPTALPDSIPAVLVDRLHVDRIELAQPVLGELVVMTLDGAIQGSGDGSRIEARLDLQRVDQPSLTMAMTSQVDLAARRLGIDLTASETGGLAGRLAGLPEAGDLDLAIKGEGPLDDWRGRLTFGLANVATADAALELGIAESASAGIEARIRPVPTALPANLRTLAGEEVELALRAELAADGSVGMENLRLALAAMDVSGQARIPADENGLSGRLIADIPDLHMLAGLAGRELDGSLMAALTLGGTRAQPAASLQIDGRSIATDGMSLARLNGELGLVSASALGETLEAADFKLHAEASGIDLDDPALPDGRPMELSANGSADRSGRVRIAALDVAALGATLQGQGELDTATLHGHGRLNGDVPALEILRPFLPPDWQALGGRGTLAVEVAADEADRDARSRFSLELAELNGLPPAIEPVLGQQVAVTADLVTRDLRHVTLNDLSAQTAALTLKGEGEAQLDGGPIRGRLDVAAADLGKFAALAGQPLSGRADLDVAIAGTVAAPSGTLRLQTHDLAGLPDDVLALLGPAPTLQAEALRQADGLLKLTELDLRTAAVTLAGNGRLMPSTGALDAQLSGRAQDVGFLGRWLGGEPKGSATLQVNATGSLAEPRAGLSLQADNLSGLPAAYADLLGDGVTLDLAGGLTAGSGEQARIARLEQIELHTAAVSASGTAAYGVDDGSLQGKLRADMDDLSRASSAAATELAGQLSLDASIGGTLAQPSLEAQLDGQRLRAAGRTLGRLTVNAEARDLVAAPTGNIRLSLTPGREPLTFSTAFRKDGSTIGLDDVELRGPGRLVLDGRLQVDTATLAADGRLVGGVRDLAALEPLVGQPLQGRLDLNLQADAGSGQSAKVTLRGSGVGVRDTILVDRLTLDAVLAGLSQAPTLRADLAADGIRRPGVDLTRSTVRVNGPLDALTVAFGTEGNATVPVKLDGGAVVRRSGDQTSVDLTRLDGSIAGRRLDLRGSTRLVLSPNRTALTGLDLRYGEASLAGNALLSGDRAEASLGLRDLQLVGLEALGAPPLDGEVEAEVRLTGSAAAPRIRLNGRGRGIGVPGASGTPLDLDLDVTATSRQLNAALSLTGLGEAPLQLTAQTPLNLALQPFVLALPPDGPLAGELTGKVDLARVARLAALDGQRLEGGLVSDLRLSGTLLRPSANGSLAVNDAAFADTSSGAALRDLNLALQASGRQIRLVRLSATDGGSGRLSGTGGVDLGQPDLPFQASVRLDDFRPLHRDDLLVRMGGTLDVRGDKAAANIVGRLRVDRAEISIPEGGSGGAIPVIEPTTGPGAPADGGAGAVGPPYRAGLDIVVDMPERIFVRGRGLESEWGGAVQVKGTIAEPVVTGRIEVKRGFLNFLDRRFDLERGIVSLDGAVPPDPELDIRATFEANSLLGILQVAGRVSDPTIELTSDPVRPQDEIMAEILFGRDVSKISAVQGLQLAAALNSLRGGGGGGLLDNVRQRLGVDTLDFGGENAEDASVKAGKYISDDVFLQVERGVAPGSGRATVEVEVAPNVTVQTEVTEDSQTGFGLQWKYDY